MNTYKVSVARGMFNVRDRGNKDGFPLVMVHGWPESSYCWEGVASFLNPSLRVIAPDLRGLGESERTLDVNAYSKIELAKDIIEVLDSLGVSDFYLAGHDWGGIVAQELALLVPERVKKFVIMNIAVITNPKGYLEGTQTVYSRGAVPFWYQYFQQSPILPERMIKGNEDVWVPHFFTREIKHNLVPAEAIAEYIRCHQIEHTPGTAANYYRMMRSDEKRWGALAGKKFPMPTLYIYGKKDGVIVPEYLNHLEDGFESVKIEYVDAGHFVQEEKPQEVAALLNEFLKP